MSQAALSLPVELLRLDRHVSHRAGATMLDAVDARGRRLLTVYRRRLSGTGQGKLDSLGVLGVNNVSNSFAELPIPRENGLGRMRADYRRHSDTFSYGLS